jgi:hypothetical protein
MDRHRVWYVRKEANSREMPRHPGKTESRNEKQKEGNQNKKLNTIVEYSVFGIYLGDAG